jgi:hypothetical protein
MSATENLGVERPGQFQLHKVAKLVRFSSQKIKIVATTTIRRSSLVKNLICLWWGEGFALRR